MMRQKHVVDNLTYWNEKSKDVGRQESEMGENI